MKQSITVSSQLIQIKTFEGEEEDASSSRIEVKRNTNLKVISNNKKKIRETIHGNFSYVSAYNCI